jgi:chromosome segregation protein
VFSLSDGITAIVGPNGSGKSNVADAVRWVLGEQSARVLRGTKMEDVIFSGTTTRKPISLCEVVLLFDNEDKTLPLPHNELAVTRKLFRNGESEYLLNGQSVRMRDIQSLFYDTGVGREGYSIIGQGRIEEILSSKGEERREALEEAAGVMKFKMRREEAQRKLTSVAADIVRIDDILIELGQSIEPLRDQKEKAEQAKNWQDRLKELEINLFLNQYDRNRTRAKAIGAETTESERAEAQLKKTLADDQQNLQILLDKMDLVEGLVNRAREKRMELTTALSNAQSGLVLTEQRLAFLRAERERISSQHDDLKSREAAIVQALSLGAAPQVDLSGFEGEEVAAADRLNALNQALGGLEDALDAKKRQLLQHVDGDALRKARLARFEALRSQAQERETELRASLAQAHEERLGIEAEIAQAEAAHADAKRDVSQTEQNVASLAKALKEAREETEKAQKAHTAALGEYQRAENALRIQQQLLRDFEGYNNSVRNLMRDITGKAIGDAGVLGTVANLMRVPKEYETAIEQVLGGSLQNLVVDTQQTAKRLIDHLRAKQYGRVTFLPLQSLRANPLTRDERAGITGPGVIGIASDLIGCDEAVRRGVDYLLGRTVIVEDLDAGIALANRCRFSFRIVTKKGDILQSGGPMTGGSVREFALVSRERLVSEAEAALINAKGAVDLTKTRSERCEKDTIALYDRHTQARDSLVRLQAGERMANERLLATLHALDRAGQACERIEAEYNRIIQTILDAEEETVRIESAKPLDEQALRLAIDADTAKLASLRNEHGSMRDALSQLRENLAVMRGEKRSFENDRARMQAELLGIRANLAQADADLEKNLDEQHKANAELDGIRTQSQKATGAQEENMRALVAVQSQFDAQKEERTQLSLRIEENRTALSDQREKKFRLETQLQRLESDFEHMQTRLWENYELTYAQAKTFEKEMNLPNAAQEAEELREVLKNLGMVNLGAIEEYKRVFERHAYLQTQKDDLVRAKEDLDQLIVDLTLQMQKQFLEQFDIINAHFDRIFKNLFHGGRAELILSDPRQAMECTIDIVAQPPGKNLQMITLLSGGERALTAIALLFALLEVRATPFCILDEIESALDEENLRLFSDFLKTYSKNTQFVIITHRRPTMEAASYMYGIAMEEAGVSKTVSVKFA